VKISKELQIIPALFIVFIFAMAYFLHESVIDTLNTSIIKTNVSYLMNDSARMYASVGCYPTSIKSLNNRFYQMKPKSNTCDKAIPASFTEVYEWPRASLVSIKKFSLNHSSPVRVTIGANPSNKNNFGVIISNLNNDGVETFSKIYRKSDPVTLKGGMIFLGFKTFKNYSH
jgi:hypothetical protein